MQSDLNGDGIVERFALIDNGEGTVDLQIENTGGGVIYADDIAWLGGIGQKPTLDVAPNGALRVISMNDAIGRSRWELTLTVAFRGGTYRVAGYTYRWRDTILLEDNGDCDLNLLTGRGVLTVDGATRDVRTDQAAVPVTSWDWAAPIPAVCMREP